MTARIWNWWMLQFLAVLRGRPWERLRCENTAFSFTKIALWFLLAEISLSFSFQIMASGTDEALKSTGLVLAGTKHIFEIHWGCSDSELTLWVILDWFFVQHWVRSFILSVEVAGLEGTSDSYWSIFLRTLNFHSSNNKSMDTCILIYANKKKVICLFIFMRQGNLVMLGTSIFITNSFFFGSVVV